MLMLMASSACSRLTAHCVVSNHDIAVATVSCILPVTCVHLTSVSGQCSVRFYGVMVLWRLVACMGSSALGREMAACPSFLFPPHTTPSQTTNPAADVPQQLPVVGKKGATATGERPLSSALVGVFRMSCARGEAVQGVRCMCGVQFRAPRASAARRFPLESLCELAS
jgi:hypothetical protein